jgi:hypothetical protein
MDKLSDWIRPQYLDFGVVEQMRTVFAREGQLLVQDFLRKDAFARVQHLTKKAQFKRTYVPQQMSCAFGMQQDAFLRFLSSERFRAYVNLITSIPSGKKAFYTEFGKNDYTILNDVPQTWKLVTHYFVMSSNKAWGGRLIWRAKDGSHRYVLPTQNSLALTKNKKGVRGYVEYVNHHIGKKKLIAANV